MYINNLKANPVLLPVQSSERLQVLDILRGFAILGILMVNMEYFSNPMQVIILPVALETMSAIDRIATWLVRFAAEGKFYSIFSFLFGYGFTIILTRTEAAGLKFKTLFIRRLIILLLIGAMHILLLWTGDILTMYALLGFVLILFRKAKPKTLIIWAIILLVLPLLFMAFGVAAIELGRMFPEGAKEIDKSFAEQTAMHQKDIAQAYTVYASGNFIQIIEQRIRDLKFLSFALFAIGPNVLAMFLIGVYFGKRRILQEIDSNTPLLRKLSILGLIIGVIGNAIYATFIQSISRIEPTPTLLLATFGQVIGAPALSLFYISAIALFIFNNPTKRFLNKLAPAGKLALSNYLMHSVIFTTIFYGYGFGLYGQISKSAGLVIGIAVFILQIIISNWWIKKFRFGPVEWLWRWGTYLKKP